PVLELVWTGPEARYSTTRDTSVVVSQLFASARREVIIAGFSFDDGATIFEPLHARMCEAAVEASLYTDIRRAPSEETGNLRHVDRIIETFLASNWPFGDPVPKLFYDPRTITANAVASLHAKCIVVDDLRALVTSANFTDRGHTRNIEVGVLI